MRVKYLVKLSFASLLVVIAIGCIAQQKVAAFGLNPDPGVPSDIRAVEKASLENCNGQQPTISPAFQTWLGGDVDGGGNKIHGATSIEVPYGSQSANLTFSFASAPCSMPNYVPESRLHIRDAAVYYLDGTLAGTTSGAVGQTLALGNGTNYVGQYTGVTIPFQFNANKKLTQNNTIRVVFHTQSINRQTNIPNGNDPYRCIGQTVHYSYGDHGKAAGGGWNYQNCQDWDVSVDITITLSPVGSVVAAGCNLGKWDGSNTELGIVGWAHDNDHYPTDVIVYVDTGSGIPQWVGRYTANYQPSFAPSGYQPPEWHDWFRVPKKDIARFNDISANKFYVNVVDKWPDGTDKGQVALEGSPLNIGRCVDPQCGTLTILPDSPEPNQPFTVQASAGLTGPVPRRNVNFSIKVDTPGWGGVLGTGRFDAASGSTFSTIPSPPKQIAGKPLNTYNVGYTITYDNGLIATCNSSIKIAAKPFFNATAGDILSGFSPDGTNCTSATGWSATANPVPLAGWHDIPTNNGSGTTLAALALNVIDGVRSAQSQSPPENLSKLSFANQAGANNYGGNYGGTLNCPKDYYSYHTTATNIGTPAVPPTLDTQTPPAPAPPTNLTLGGTTFNAASPGNKGTRSVLYVYGNVYITGDIKLANTGPSITDPSQLANFYLIVKGNIYISPNVKQLDGVYVAQGNGTTGQIYTCAFNMTPPTAAQVNDATNGCRKNALIVNGAFIADKVNLYRGYGTLNQNQPAETFNFTPTVWLAPPKSLTPLFGGTGTSTNNSYDAITTLQPVL